MVGEGGPTRKPIYIIALESRRSNAPSNRNVRTSVGPLRLGSDDMSSIATSELPSGKISGVVIFDVL